MSANLNNQGIMKNNVKLILYVYFLYNYIWRIKIYINPTITSINIAASFRLDNFPQHQ